MARLEEAAAVLETAQAGLERAEARGAESQALAERFAELRKRNHFSEGLAAMLRESGNGHAPDVR